MFIKIKNHQTGMKKNGDKLLSFESQLPHPQKKVDREEAPAADTDSSSAVIAVASPVMFAWGGRREPPKHWELWSSSSTTQDF